VSSKYTKIKLHTITDRTAEAIPRLWVGMYHGAHRREYVMVDFLRTSSILKQVDKKIKVLLSDFIIYFPAVRTGYLEQLLF